jgi:antitoxin (DNA-binding transcriptional repressor) of toxin-antitoxin stability system
MLHGRHDHRTRSQVVAKVEAGTELIVTHDGTPVARIAPERLSDRRLLTPEQKKALGESPAWLKRGWPLGIKHFDRK